MPTGPCVVLTREAEDNRPLARALGARGVPVREIVNCGGLASRNPFLMQVYADITGRPMTGWVTVEPDGYESDEALIEWVRQGVDFALSLPPK